MIFDQLKRLLSDRAGNVTLMFTLSAGALLAGSATAVDYSRYSNTRSILATAADAAALAGARTEGTAQAREAAAKQMFEANLKTASLSGTPSVIYKNIVTNGVNSGYRVEASADVKALMGFFSQNSTQRSPPLPRRPHLSTRPPRSSSCSTRPPRWKEAASPPSSLR